MKSSVRHLITDIFKLCGLRASLLHIILTATFAAFVRGCTNIIVTPGASEDGNMILAYSSDSHNLYGFLYHYPPVKVAPGSSMDVYDWDSGELRGAIPQVAPVGEKSTFNVVGNCNQHNLCIGETTFAGVPELLEQPEAIVDYGSLIYITLQRTRTAVQALRLMTELVQDYGYASEGESFSIVDTKEAYLLEMIGKGTHQLGSVWVSCKVPDGTILAHANHARIGSEFLYDETCDHSDDVIEFAIQTGLYKPSSPDDFSDFSFSAVYDPKKTYEMRYTDARVWDIYRSFMTPEDQKAFDVKYMSHVMGHDVHNKDVLPLFLMKPSKKVSLNDIRARMSSHYENTALEYGNDVGGGLFEMPYRPRPNSWKYQGKTYVNERSVAVPKTGWNFIAHLRSLDRVAHECLQTVFWFGADDCSTAPRIPVFPCAIGLSTHFYGLGSQQGHTSPIMHWDMDKAFWIQNMVSNFVYYRWSDSYPVLKEKLDQVHHDFERQVENLENQVALLMSKGSVEGVDFDVVKLISAFTVKVGDDLHRDWIKFYGQLFVTFRDFVHMKVDKNNAACGCFTDEIGMNEVWKERIIAQRGDHYEVVDQTQAHL